MTKVFSRYDVLVNASSERLIALANAHVDVAILRAADQRGTPVYRSGRVRLLGTPDAVQFAVEAARNRPIARIADADGGPIATLLGCDRLSVRRDAVRVEFRSSFRVDVGIVRPLAEAHEDLAPMTFERAARDLAAELEAGFRSELLLRPDPDPAAGLRARYGVAPIEPGPLGDGSVRFAVGHAAATLRPDGADGVRLTCIGTEIRDGRQVTDIFEPLRGPRYELAPDDVERLAADIRAFLANRRERFTSPAGDSRR